MFPSHCGLSQRQTRQDKTRPEQWQLAMDMLTWKKKISQDRTPRKITTTNQYARKRPISVSQGRASLLMFSAKYSAPKPNIHKQQKGTQLIVFVYCTYSYICNNNKAKEAIHLRMGIRGGGEHIRGAGRGKVMQLDFSLVCVYLHM